DAKDYRYFPEPDLMPLVISDEWLEEIKGRQPELRDEKMERYAREFDIPEYDIAILTGTKKLADIFEATTTLCGKPKKVSNWLMVETMRLLKERNMDAEDISFSPKHLAGLIELVEAREINGTVAKEVFERIFAENIDPVSYVEEKGLKTVSDEGALRETIQRIMEENPQSVTDYKNGKTKAMGFLTGQTMKAMKGKADPAVINKILLELIS
ncbi:MAG: Asp-tRNA(Asn)/Glu-tRNA(Gln) amidotransferase GatCAB subunit B, partial [Acetivibrio ethanolgignens]